MTVPHTSHSLLNVISTHTLTWSVTTLLSFLSEHPVISTHTLTWSVTIFGYVYAVMFCISTHTLTWSVTRKDKDLIRYVQNFNSHAHVERDTCTLHTLQAPPNFNSHAHVERDWALRHPILPVAISTHTLTWSVTNGSHQQQFRINISTHTLTWSVT